MEPQQTGLPFRRIETLRPALPIHPPPQLAPVDLPALPCPQRKPIFDAPYRLSTHIIPAAYLRTTGQAPIPPPPPSDANKIERKRAIARIRDDMITAKEQSSRNPEGYPQALWNCVNRYVRIGSNEATLPSRRRITLFLAHANGFTKEVWEPMLAHLLSSDIAQFIDEVWSWEAIQHGDAGLLNAANASGSFDSTDNARDIVNFLSNFLPPKATEDVLPVHLGQVSSREAKLRLERGFSDRNLVVMGHSFGGTSLAHAASLFPALFASVVLIDPILLEPFVQVEVDRTVRLLLGALGRREEWPSRTAALNSFLESPFFRSWDPAALDIYIQCALYTTASGTVRLKTPGALEATIYLDCKTPNEVFQRMTELDETISLRFIMPDISAIESFAGSEKRLWLRPRNSTSVKIRGAGHLIPHEALRQLGEVALDCLGD